MLSGPAPFARHSSPTSAGGGNLQLTAKLVARKRPLSVGKLCPWPIPHLAQSTHFRVVLGIVDLSLQTSQDGSETIVKTCQGQRGSRGRPLRLVDQPSLARVS
jgi:hypothetical protein